MKLLAITVLMAFMATCGQQHPARHRKHSSTATPKQTKGKPIVVVHDGKLYEIK